MSREMPEGGWTIEYIAEVVGADPKQLRSHAIKWAVPTSLKRGRFVTSSRGVEYLLMTADAYGCDPTEAYDRWYNQPSTDEVTSSINSGASGASAVAAARSQVLSEEAGEKLATLHGQNKFLTETVVDLLSVVAQQQRQIQELFEQVEATGLARVQENVSDKASVHLQTALTKSATVLQGLGSEHGEVSVGNVLQKGRISLKRDESQESNSSSETAEENSKEVEVDVETELSGIAAKVANLEIDVGVDVSRFEKLTKQLTESKKSRSKESYEGEFEIEYQGVKVKVGK